MQLSGCKPSSRPPPPPDSSPVQTEQATLGKWQLSLAPISSGAARLRCHPFRTTGILVVRQLLPWRLSFASGRSVWQHSCPQLHSTLALCSCGSYSCLETLPCVPWREKVLRVGVSLMAGERAQWVERLSHKHEDPSLDSPEPIESSPG